MKYTALFLLLVAHALHAQSVPSVHAEFKDVWYILESAATLVTDGKYCDIKAPHSNSAVG